MSTIRGKKLVMSPVTENFFKVPNQFNKLIIEKNLGRTEIMVILYLLENGYNKNHIFLQTTIASKLNINKYNCNRTIKSLESKGILTYDIDNYFLQLRLSNTATDEVINYSNSDNNKLSITATEEKEVIKKSNYELSNTATTSYQKEQLEVIKKSNLDPLQTTVEAGFEVSNTSVLNTFENNTSDNNTSDSKILNFDKLNFLFGNAKAYILNSYNYYLNYNVKVKNENHIPIGKYEIYMLLYIYLNSNTDFKSNNIQSICNLFVNSNNQDLNKYHNDFNEYDKLLINNNITFQKVYNEIYNIIIKYENHTPIDNNINHLSKLLDKDLNINTPSKDFDYNSQLEDLNLDDKLIDNNTSTEDDELKFDYDFEDYIK